MLSAEKPKRKRKSKPAVPRPAEFRRAIAAFRRAQYQFNDANLEPPALDRAGNFHTRAKCRLIGFILAVHGEDWDPNADEWIVPAAVILPDGTVLATRMAPDDDYGYPPYARPALAIVEPERVAKL